MLSRLVNPLIRITRHSSQLRPGPDLSHFIAQASTKRAPKVFPAIQETDSYLKPEDYHGDGRKVRFITHGCQMNVNDMEVVRGILFENGYVETESEKAADVILLMTCSIRESAEDKIWRKLKNLRAFSKKAVIGVLGCMAERVREGIIERSKTVDVVAGPDAYRDLPRLLAATRLGHSAMNVQLSLEETYADVQPVRVDTSSKSAFVSIMRGCDNMCSYCVVPFTRGRERSRPLESIVDEVRQLSDQGFKQVILLGQNVNSYRDMTTLTTTSSPDTASTAEGFKTIYKPKVGGRTFATLLAAVSDVDPEMRIRFTSPHPKDFPLPVLELIRERRNICSQLHLPAQSGDDAVLAAMRRGYTRDAYLQLVERIKDTVPGVGLTSDFIAGFCGETEEAHARTLELMRTVGYYFCFVFPYSMRERTHAHRRLVDDVPNEVKQRRSNELAEVFREVAQAHNRALVDSEQLVLVEGQSRRSKEQMAGRIDGGPRVVFDNVPLPSKQDASVCQPSSGDYVAVKIRGATSQTLYAEPLYRTSLAAY